MSDRLDAARHFVDSWDDPEMRRFAEEYAAEQTIDFARLAVDQAEQIARLQAALRKTIGIEGLSMFDLYQDGSVTHADMEEQ